MVVGAQGRAAVGAAAVGGRGWGGGGGWGGGPGQREGSVDQGDLDLQHGGLHATTRARCWWRWWWGKRGPMDRGRGRTSCIVMPGLSRTSPTAPASCTHPGLPSRTPSPAHCNPSPPPPSPPLSTLHTHTARVVPV